MWLLMGNPHSPYDLYFFQESANTLICLSYLPECYPLFFSNMTPASGTQRVTWGCCSYFLLPKLSSTLGLFHQVLVDTKMSQVRAKSQVLSSSKNKSQVERDPKNVFVRAAIKQSSSQARVYCKHT